MPSYVFLYGHVLSTDRHKTASIDPDKAWQVLYAPQNETFSQDLILYVKLNKHTISLICKLVLIFNK